MEQCYLELCLMCNFAFKGIYRKSPLHMCISIIHCSYFHLWFHILPYFMVLHLFICFPLCPLVILCVPHSFFPFLTLTRVIPLISLNVLITALANHPHIYFLWKPVFKILCDNLHYTGWLPCIHLHHIGAYIMLSYVALVSFTHVIRYVSSSIQPFL